MNTDGEESRASATRRSAGQGVGGRHQEARRAEQETVPEVRRAEQAAAPGGEESRGGGDTRRRRQQEAAATWELRPRGVGASMVLLYP
jgi:hypothetical protein